MKVVYVQIPKMYGSSMSCVPVCHACGKVIFDVREGNICPVTDEPNSTKVEMEAFCWPCDPHTHPWMSLAQVFSRDQRKRTGSGRLMVI